MRIPSSELALLLALLAAPALAAAGGDDPATPALDWNLRTAEHLLNRAGFGATPREVRAAVELGHAALVRALVAGPEQRGEPYLARKLSTRDGVRPADLAMDELGMEPDSARAAKRVQRSLDKEQLQDYASFWVERMLAGDDPLRERVALFWHGHFTSSYRDVKSSHAMIEQSRLFRDLGLGPFGDLLRAIARDPAMLEYLDNNKSVKESPNENFARELLELFTLGEGNYGERDIKEVARAFTGWTERRGEFHFDERKHDDGQKTVFGVRGDLNGDDVLDAILAHEACAPWIARRLIRYFEGVEPDAQRLAEYAALLRAEGYHVGRFLERLFLDPRFYRDEVQGARVASPIDFLVGSARRIGVDAPAEALLLGARMLGESLFDPPSVKGWDGGLAWLTTSTLMARGNLAGLLLGEVELESALRADDELASADGAAMDDAAMDDAAPKALRPGGEMRALARLARSWSPRLELGARLECSGRASDRELVDALLEALLAIAPPESTRANVLHEFTAERERMGVDEGDLLAIGAKAEALLRRTAHLILCLPEAQLH